MAENENVDIDSLKEEESEIFDPQIVAEVEATETPPDFYSEEWSDYVLRQFRDDELIEGHPKHSGLLRIAESLIGPVMSRTVQDFVAPTKENLGTATVHSRMVFLVTNELHPLAGHQLIEDGIAEVNEGNSAMPFLLHPSATASSKAEAQALRKALRLRNLVAADEIAPDESAGVNIFMPETMIAPEEITIIDVSCKRINMSVLDFIACGDTRYLCIEEVPGSKAKAMIKFLGEIASQKKVRPVEKVYDPAWREKNAQRRTGGEE